MKHCKERPCPGCGTVDPRPPQALCRDCRRQLELGRRREKEITLLDTSGEKIKIAIKTDFAYGFASGSAIGFLKFSHTDVVDTLVRLGGLEDASRSGGTYKKARPIYFTYSIPYSTTPRQFVWATPEQADAIENILSYIREVCKEWYMAGFKKGSDLLWSIAQSGIEESNRITMMREAAQ